MTIKVYVNWCDGGGHPPFQIAVDIHYVPPADRFWDDALVEMLQTNELEKALADAPDFRDKWQLKMNRSQSDCRATLRLSYYMSTLVPFILSSTKNANSWTLSRRFGDPTFVWTHTASASAELGG